MKTAKHFQGYRITKYDNDSNCYVFFYENIDCTRSDNTSMNWAYAKRKFSITEKTYTSHREANKTVYTRK